MKICILHIGHHDPTERSKHLPSPERFKRALAPHLPDAVWTVISAVTNELPDVEAHDAYIITGGKYSVFEKLDWQDRLFDFIRELSECRKPLIGVCYGHQAIAFALGGDVDRSDKGWGVGLMPVDVSRSTAWAEAQSDILLHAMHQDQVTTLPAGAEVFLSSDFCPISGFTIGQHFLAIQQHPDFTPELNEDLIRRRIDRIGDAAQPALNSLSGRDDTETSVDWMAGFLRTSLQNQLQTH